MNSIERTGDPRYLSRVQLRESLSAIRGGVAPIYD
jgi:hypothetical protein